MDVQTMKKEDMRATTCCFKYSKKSGKLDDQMLYGTGFALMANACIFSNGICYPTKSKDAMCVNLDTGNIIFIVEGTGEFPNIKYRWNEDLGNLQAEEPNLFASLKENCNRG